MSVSKSATSKFIKLLIIDRKIHFRFRGNNKRKHYFYIDIQDFIEYKNMINKYLFVNIRLCKKDYKTTKKRE